MTRAALVCLAVLLMGCSEPGPPQRAAAPARTAPAKILHFYPSVPSVPRGEQVLLCYGVESAASLRMEPAVEGVSPSPNRCVAAKPQSDTTYVLTATGKTGEPATAQVQVKVTAARTAVPAAGAPEGEGQIILSFVSTSTQVGPGQPVTICYDATGADSVKLEPSPEPAKSGKQCIGVRPERTTTYKLTASKGSRSEIGELTIRVQ
jgi:hypothetical protein